MKKFLLLLAGIAILLSSCVKIYEDDCPCPPTDSKKKVEVAFTFDGDILQGPLTKAALSAAPPSDNIHWFAYDGDVLIAEGDYVLSPTPLVLSVAPGTYKFKFVGINNFTSQLTINSNTDQHLYASTKVLTVDDNYINPTKVTLTRVISAVRVAQHKGNSANFTINSVTLQSLNTLNLVSLDKSAPLYELSGEVTNTAAALNAGKYDPANPSLTPELNYVFPGQTVRVMAYFTGPSGKAGTVTRDIIIAANTIYTVAVFFNTQDGKDVDFEISIDPGWNPEQVIQ